MLPSMFDEDEEEEEGNIVAYNLSNISQQDFKGCQVYMIKSIHNTWTNIFVFILIHQ